jgi:sulfide:quinone oxidoreductase
MTGDRRPESISRQRARLARHGVEFVNADVREIDLANRHVWADSREFRYDYLVIALGAETTLDTKPGLAEAAQSFYTLDGAERLAASLRYFSGGKVLISVAGLPFKCPPAPYEAAMLLEHYFHSRRMRQKVDIEIHTPETMPLGITGPANSEMVADLLAHKGIELGTSRQLVSVDTHRHETVYADGSTTPFQLLIAVPEHRAPPVVRGLVDETGWVSIDPQTMETTYENVFAIGDMTYIRLPDGLQLPKAGVFAEHQGFVAARHIAYKVLGGPAPDTFDGHGRCFLEVGAGAAGMADGDFLAPQRQISLKQPSIVWHWTKAAFERYWLWKWY